MTERELLALYAVQNGGDWVRTAKAIREGKQPEETGIRRKYITILDHNYPDCFRKLRYPPWVLFYEGNIALLRKEKITVVGSRELTEYGREMTRAVSEILRDRYVIVSGLAKGADAEAHRTALSGGYTIGVIGSGLDTHYPKCNEPLYEEMRRNHLILSEYPDGIGVEKYHFPWRNRLLAALGNALIVTQAEIASGTMHTVNEAIALSKDIWCVPYRIGEPGGSGCDKLISEGAYILYDLCQLKEARFSCRY